MSQLPVLISLRGKKTPFEVDNYYLSFWKYEKGLIQPAVGGRAFLEMVSVLVLVFRCSSGTYAYWSFAKISKISDFFLGPYWFIIRTWRKSGNSNFFSAFMDVIILMLRPTLAWLRATGDTWSVNHPFTIFMWSAGRTWNTEYGRLGSPDSSPGCIQMRG